MRGAVVMKKILSLIVVLIVISMSCSSTQYMDSKNAKGSREWGPKEVKVTVNKMVRSLYSFLVKDWKKPVIIEVKRIRNTTSEHINTRMLSNELVNNLLKRRIMFVDPRFSKDAIKEMSRGMTGMVDEKHSVPTGQLRSPNCYLYGEISENVRYTGSKKIQYLVVTLKLKSLRTGVLLWQEQKEFLKASASDRIDF